MGTGFDCASQGSTKLWLTSPITASNLDFGGNLGGVSPIGSIGAQNGGKKNCPNEEIYLKFGTGRPCAGQSKAKLDLDFLSYENVFESEEKLGAFDPIGSNGRIFRFNFCFWSKMPDLLGWDPT